MKNIGNIIAKSNGESLVDHSIKAGKIGYELSRRLTDDKSFIEAATFACFMHDIGKCTNDFQKHIINGSDTITLHNVASAFFLSKYMGDYFVGNKKNSIIKSVMYHHPMKNVEQYSDFNRLTKTISDKDIDIMFDVYAVLIDEFNKITGLKFAVKRVENTDEISSYTPFSDNFKVNYNECFIFISSVVKTADILASNGCSIEEYIGTSNVVTEFNCPDSFDNSRFLKQKRFADVLRSEKYGHVTAVTGFGKTIVGLMWGLYNGKKTWWVLPRNVIAEGIYDSIVRDLRILEINKVDVALLLGGEWKYGSFNSDIIVTNIDNVTRPMINSDSNYRNYNMLYDNVIFDEYHEYISKNGSIMAAFLSFAKARAMLNKSGNTLFMSATPCKNAIEEIERVYGKKMAELYDDECEILNRQFKMEFSEQFPSDTYNGKSTLVYCNSVKSVQNLKVCDVVDNILHSEYTGSDKEKIKGLLYNEHGKGKRVKTSWGATNVLSTGIDVSFENMVYNSPVPERMLQAMGRVGRWDIGNTAHEIVLICPNDSDKREKNAIETFYDFELAKRWYNFLKQNVEGKTVKLRILYELLKEFYRNEKFGQMYGDYYKDCRCSSFENLKNVMYARSSSVNNGEEASYVSKNGFRKNEYEEFFCSFKMDAGEYSEPITVSTMKFSDLQEDRYSVAMQKYLDKCPAIREKYMRVRQWEGFKRKCDKRSSYRFETFLSMAKCSKTPFIVCGGEWKYDNVLGIVKDS